MCHKKIMRKRTSDNISEEPPKKRISPGGNVLPIKIVPGEILTDLQGKQWRLGKTLGHGGFGDIYLASDNIKEPVKNDAPYVIKIEDHSNGPLFVEINCLLRIAKLQMIEEWNNKHKNEQIGMPHYIASGSHTFRSEKLRFLVIPRYEQDLEKLFLNRNKRFNIKTVIMIATQILNTLEYIHSKGYVHCDVKASNILYSSSTFARNNNNAQTGLPMAAIPTKEIKPINRASHCIRSCRLKALKRNDNLRQIQRINYTEDCEPMKIINFDENFIEVISDDEEEIITPKPKINNDNHVVLIDYGLATKYLQPDGRHKQYVNDERKAHAGTVLFCSIDAHLGASSRRSDLESLGYNMIYWLTSKLPWENDVHAPEIVQNKKENCLNNLDVFLKSCFVECPTFIYEYFKYVKSLTFESKPDYSFCKKMLQTALQEYGYKKNNCFDFDNVEGWGQKPKKIKRNIENVNMKQAVKSGRVPLTSNIIVEKKPTLRKQSGKKVAKQNLNWSKILSDPEEILRNNTKIRERKLTESSDSSCNGTSVQTLDIYSLNPTYAMIEIFNKTKDKNGNFNGLHKNGKGDCFELEREGYTPAMNLVLTRMHQKRGEEMVQETENCHSAKKARISKMTIKKQPKTSTNIEKTVTRKSTRSTRVLRGHGLRG